MSREFSVLSVGKERKRRGGHFSEVVVREKAERVSSRFASGARNAIQRQRVAPALSQRSVMASILERF